jgi:integrase
MTRAKIRINKIGDRKYQVSFKDPKTRKRVRRQFRHKTAAELFKAETENRITRGCTPGGQLYVGNVLRIFLSAHPTTVMIQRRNSFLSFCETFNHLEIHELTTAALKDWLAQLRRENNYRGKTLHCIKVLMNSFFKWLVQEKYLPENPTCRIKFKIHKSMQEPRVIMSDEEIKDMLIKMNEHRPDIYPFIYTLVHTGARKNEIRPLSWEQVDFWTGFIRLHKTKNGEDRDVKMSGPLKKILSELPRTHDMMRFLSIARGFPFPCGRWTMPSPHCRRSILM